MLSAWKKLLFGVEGEFGVQCFWRDAEKLGRLSLVAAVAVSARSMACRSASASDMRRTIGGLVYRQ